MLVSAVSTPQPTIDFTSTLSNLFLWSGMCYILGPREQDSLPGLLSQRVSSAAERLWPTDGHVTTLLSLQWEAGGWWTGDGVTLDGPWSLCPRVPSPSALRDLLLLLESMIRFTLGCKPSILTQIRKSPACFMLYWIETLEKQKFSEMILIKILSSSAPGQSFWSWLLATQLHFLLFCIQYCSFACDTFLYPVRQCCNVVNLLFPSPYYIALQWDLESKRYFEYKNANSMLQKLFWFIP